MKLHPVAALPLCSFFLWAAPQRPPVPCEVLVPLLDSRQSVSAAPEGKFYPVFRVAPESKLVNEVRSELETSFAQQALKLDRYARNLLIARRETAGEAIEEALTAPMYLLMSSEEGGFARFGFWLQDGDGKRRLKLAGYVDLVVRENSVDTGDFEEIFPHELGHLIIKALTGGVPRGPAQDAPEHDGHGLPDRVLRRLRRAFPAAGPRCHQERLPSKDDHRNRCDGSRVVVAECGGRPTAHRRRKTQPVHPSQAVAGDGAGCQPRSVSAVPGGRNLTTFLPTELKNGQEMMASEGIIATLFTAW